MKAITRDNNLTMKNYCWHKMEIICGIDVSDHIKNPTREYDVLGWNIFAYRVDSQLGLTILGALEEISPYTPDEIVELEDNLKGLGYI